MPTLKKQTDTGLMWFAMSAPYCNEMKAKSLLESKNIECFVPMCYKIVESRLGVKSRKLSPAIHNLIFAHTTKKRIQEVKSGIHYLQYRVRPENGKNVPIIVPEDQMAQFMAVCANDNENLRYLLPSEVNLERGTKIRVVGGCFDGVEGTFVKVKGIRSKRVVVSLDGLASVALTEITDGLIEVIKQEDNKK
ncbi:MAG: UpxY family transcription antiterminator [Alistipes sp.]|nr:UpxY family transcription antiterminator [Alistipes sp.]MBQ3246929.1 UpxY family transcription antiterminator [Alistipes sp.]